MKRITYIVYNSKKVYSAKQIEFFNKLQERIPKEELEFVDLNINTSHYELGAKLFYDYKVEPPVSQTYIRVSRSNKNQTLFTFLVDPLIIQLKNEFSNGWSQKSIDIQDGLIRSIEAEFLDKEYPVQTPVIDPPSPEPEKKSNLLYYVLGGVALLYLIFKKK